MLNIDDPLYWMANTDPKVLDLWIAWLVVKADTEDKQKLRPADEVLNETLGRLMK